MRRRLLFLAPGAIIVPVIFVLLIWPEKAGTFTALMMIVAVILAAQYLKEDEAQKKK